MTTCYQQKYKCPLCNETQLHYTWNTEIETTKHECNTTGCKGVLTIDNIEEDIPKNGAPHIKLTKEQIQKDRKGRSHKHFMREVLPTIGDKDVRKHHLSKNGYKS